MKYFIIAGEASGDLHASNLMWALSQQDKDAHFVGLGGDKMRDAGCDIRVDYRDMAYMGVIAVLANLSKIRHNFQVARSSLLTEQPDVLILIDYPSFNLKMAEFCRKHLPNTRIVYYIPPKVWAWKSWRVHRIARYTDEVLGIFPFEPAFYAKYGYQCKYIGNPTSEGIRRWKDFHPLECAVKEIQINIPSKDTQIDCSQDVTAYHSPAKPTIIAILPGSRPSEIRHCLPTMLAAARRVVAELQTTSQNHQEEEPNKTESAQYQIIVAAAPGIDDTFYSSYLKGETLTRDTYSLLSQSAAAVVNSGTATLETALLNCPQTAVYYIACSRWLEWLIRPILFRIKYFTLVNIIPQQEVIQELIASRFTENNVACELHRLLTDIPYRQTMLTNYHHISTILGNTTPSTSAAQEIMYLLTK